MCSFFLKSHSKPTSLFNTNKNPMDQLIDAVFARLETEEKPNYLQHALRLKELDAPKECFARLRQHMEKTYKLVPY